MALKNKFTKLTKNSFWLISSNILENTVLLFMNILVIKLYGTDKHGQFVFYFNTIILLRLVLELGTDSYLTKFINAAKKNLGVLIGTISFYNIILNIPILLILWFAPLSVNMHLFVFWYIAIIISTFSTALFNGLQNMRNTFWMQFSLELAKISALIAAVYFSLNFRNFLILINVILLLPSIIISLYILFLVKGQKLKIDLKLIAPLLKCSVILWVPTVAINLLPSLLTLSIKLGLSNQDTSYFSTLFSWSMVGFIILIPITKVLFAWESHRNVLQQNETSYQSIFYTIANISLASTLVLFSLQGIILKIYGPEFVPYSLVFLILIGAQFFEYPRFFFHPIFSGSELVKTAMIVESIKALIIWVGVLIVIFLGNSLFEVVCLIFIIQWLFGWIRLFYIKKKLNKNFFLSYLRGGVVFTMATFISFKLSLSWVLFLNLILFIIFLEGKKELTEKIKFSLKVALK